MKTFQNYIEDIGSIGSAQQGNPMQATTATGLPGVNASQITPTGQAQTNPQQTNPMLQQQLNPNTARSMKAIDKMMNGPGQMTFTNNNQILYSFNGVTTLTKQPQLTTLVTLPQLIGIELTGKGLAFRISKN